MPSSLATSGIVAPAESLASASRSLRMICSGECLLPIKSPPYAHSGLLDSHSDWISFRGAGQGHRDDPQVRLSSAEVMTIALVACTFFSGNLEASRAFLDEYGYIKKAISKSRFNRRLHAIDPALWRTLFDVLAEVFKHEHSEQTTYVVDSLPVAVCDNIRIRR